jgi:hypothetical protein
LAASKKVLHSGNRGKQLTTPPGWGIAQQKLVCIGSMGRIELAAKIAKAESSPGTDGGDSVLGRGFVGPPM